MSRRESCVWHPMPEEVSRTSVQSRRASLAAGRRKSMNTNQPDWEVEAPPTPPREVYTPRDNQAAVPTGRTVAAGAAGAAGGAAAGGTAASGAAKASKERSRIENEAAVGAAGAADHDAVASVKSEEPMDMSDDEGALQANAQTDAEAAGKGRTRHIIRFHGDKWAKVLRKKRTEIEAAFLEDAKNGAGVKPEEAKRLKIKMHDCMEVSFVLYSESRARQKKIHAALQKYKFPKTCQLYIAFGA
ncbi:hypothetical protein ABL78_8057 [Leptomonas seymouri]|uniref:Flagellar attachment zone protein 1 conserved domain-containing protein n=1 Tax=Leptomonas seymouri TaxID=5684 RepID=A0A0N1I142_LEPSE|nr:hypothetical protein ABL78_8057 [Leptomonas seymouri]|eukprot:KPI82930.1 hypothetical protein ABL78_8057 [Leptomonas seymouri]